VMAEMGVIPVDMPGGEIYQALQKRAIDAAEWIGPYDDQKLGLNKVAPYYYYPGWWEGGLELALLVHRKAYEALPVDYKAIVKAASSVAHADMLAKYDALNPHALKQLVVAKTKVLPFSSPVLDAAFRAAMEVFSHNESRSPQWKKIYADMRDFQRDQIFWFRFAEARYDSFMSAQRI
jgi:TRAP-type mannitol/chloroaromatic compound transport system substrate-binding protein